MSRVFLCSNCGQRLAEPPETRDRSAQDIIKRSSGYCPKCGHELKFDSDRIRMYPI